MRPCLLVDFLWEQFAEEAADSSKAGVEIEPLWRTGATLSQAFDEADPRRAASLHCLAAIAREAGDTADAEARYRDSIAAWERVPEWVSQMDVEFTGRSASMHIRLEMKRTEELRKLKRSINTTLAQGGLSAVLSNLAELLHMTGRSDEAEALYRRARKLRETSLSHREAGVAIICDNLAGLLEDAGRQGEAKEQRARAREIDAEPFHAGIEDFRRKRWRKMTDIRKLTAAVYLAPPCRRAGTPPTPA